MTSNFILFLVYFFSILLSSRTRLLTPGHTNPIRTKATEVKQIEAVTRIEPKTCAALPIISGALSTELSRSCGDKAQNGAYKPMLIARLSRNFEFRKQKLRSRNLSHCLCQKPATHIRCLQPLGKFVLYHMNL